MSLSISLKISRKVNLILLIGATVLGLKACAPSTTPSTATSSTATSPTASPPAAQPPAASSTASPTASPTPVASDPAVAQHGGQVVQTGNYHLELLALPEGENMHVDFWLLIGSDHASIGDAKVTANVQFPNGTQKTVDMTYDQAGQHYKAYIPGFVAGDYRVVVQTDRQGEKVNGRFNFKL